jgi:hypothetical protein
MVAVAVGGAGDGVGVGAASAIWLQLDNAMAAILRNGRSFIRSSAVFLSEIDGQFYRGAAEGPLAGVHPVAYSPSGSSPR